MKIERCLKKYTKLLKVCSDKKPEGFIKDRFKELIDEFMDSGISFDEIAQIHIMAVESIIKDYNSKEAVSLIIGFYDVLIKVIIEYGSIYTKYIEDKANNVATLSKVNLELKKSIDELSILFSFSNQLNKVNSIDELKDVTKATLENIVDVGYLDITLEDINCQQQDVLIIPIMVSGEKYATFILKSSKTGELTTIYKEFFQIIVNQLAVTVERLNLYEELKILSITDSKTRLYNFMYYNNRLEDEIRNAEKNSTSVALLMIDIDNFKVYNDNCGHFMGDLVIEQLGKILKEQIRESDIAARFGGEEFTVILPGINKKDAYLVAEKIRNKVKEGIVVSNKYKYPNITISIGVSIFPENGKTPSELVKTADIELYKAKAAGKDQVSCAFEF